MEPSVSEPIVNTLITAWGVPGAIIVVLGIVIWRLWSQVNDGVRERLSENREIIQATITLNSAVSDNKAFLEKITAGLAVIAEFRANLAELKELSVRQDERMERFERSLGRSPRTPRGGRGAAG